MNYRRLFTPLLTALLFFAAVSCNDASLIPKKTMQQIYYDMFMADGYIESLPDARLKTDSLRVYAPIFEKYGYTEQQFLETQANLLDKPEKLEKIISSVRERLQKRLAEVTREVEVLDSIADAKYAMLQDSITSRENFLDSLSFACILDTICLTFSADTVGVAVLVHEADTTATAGSAKDTVKAAPARKYEIVEKEPEDRGEVAIEEDFEFQELQMLEEASKRHQESIAKKARKEKKQKKNK